MNFLSARPSIFPQPHLPCLSVVLDTKHPFLPLQTPWLPRSLLGSSQSSFQAFFLSHGVLYHGPSSQRQGSTFLSLHSSSQQVLQLLFHEQSLHFHDFVIQDTSQSLYHAPITMNSLPHQSIYLHRIYPVSAIGSAPASSTRSLHLHGAIIAIIYLATSCGHFSMI